MLRYRAPHFKKRPILWILLFIIASAALILGTIARSSSIIYLVVSGILVVNIYFNAIPFNRINKEYSHEFNTIVEQIKNMFSRKAGGHIFLRYGLRNTFPQDFLDEIVFRWRSDKTTNVGQFNKVDEVIYTDNGIIDEIERTLFVKDSRNNIIGAKEGAIERLVAMLMPAKNQYRKENGEIYQKHELSFIHDAYLEWACKNKSFDETIAADCNNLRSRLRQLPDLTAFDNTSQLRGRLFRLLYMTWLALILIAYTVYITKKSEQQAIAIGVFILILLVMMYYISMFRDRV